MNVYYLDIRKFSNDLRLWYQEVSNDRLEKVNKYRFEVDKKRALLSEMLVRYGALNESTLSNSEITFQYGFYGKPSITEWEKYFNLSHSGDYIVVLIAETEVGIDLEKVESLDLELMGKNVLSKKEKAALDSANTYNDKLCLFFKFWTLKESYLKYHGSTIAFDLPKLEFGLKEGIIEFSLEPTLNFQVTPFAENYFCGICSKKKRKDVAFIEMSESELVRGLETSIYEKS